MSNVPLPGHITATLTLREHNVREINLQPTGRFVSDNVSKLKSEVGAFLTSYLAKNNMATDEVDVMEEVLSDEDEEDEGKSKKSKKGAKRKAPG